MDKDQIIDMYEKMRAAALRFSGSVKGRHSFGYVVLSKKGIVSWSRAYAELYACTPQSIPVPPIRAQSDSEITLNDELKNILTLMALSAVEGAGHANVNGV